jgi:hypothetical protein
MRGGSQFEIQDAEDVRIARCMVYFTLGYRMGLKPWEVDSLPRKTAEIFLYLCNKVGDPDG